MIRHVAFTDLTEQHLTWIAESVLVPPAEVQVEPSDFIRAIMLGTMRLFDWEDGCILVGQRDRRLVIWGFCCHNLIKRLPQLIEDIKRLAADWECDAIETVCFSKGLARVIEKIGAKVESQTLVLPLELNNG